MSIKHALKIVGGGFLLLILAMVLDPFVSAPLIHVFGDSMDWRSRWMIGLNGLDCGRVKIRMDSTGATACALKAQQSNLPFRIRYQIQGIDSEVAAGIVRTPEGKLYAVSFDGNPHGGGYTSLILQKSWASPCPEPYHLFVNPKGRLNCFQQQLAPPRNMMSPNFEPY